MPNPLFGNMGGPNIGPFGNMMNFLNSFNQFRQNFNGNPQQMVQNLISSGQMSQDQYNQLSNMANQIMPFVKR